MVLLTLAAIILATARRLVALSWFAARWCKRRSREPVGTHPRRTSESIRLPRGRLRKEGRP
jgi:hypothetical protein